MFLILALGFNSGFITHLLAYKVISDILSLTQVSLQQFYRLGCG